jgi:hypothetical protein
MIMRFPFALVSQLNSLGKHVKRIGIKNLSDEAKLASKLAYSGFETFKISCKSKSYYFKSLIIGTNAYKDRCEIAKRIQDAKRLLVESEKAKKKAAIEAKKTGQTPYKILPRITKSDGDLPTASLPTSHASPILVPKRSKSTDDIGLKKDYSPPTLASLRFN